MVVAFVLAVVGLVLRVLVLVLVLAVVGVGR